MRQMTAAVLLAWGAAAGAAVEMQKPVELANAGIRLAAPEGFEFVATSGPAVLAAAVRRVEGKPVQSMTLAVRLEDPTCTPGQLADHVQRETAEGLDVRELAVVKSWPAAVAGAPGVARRVTYVNRGQKMSAIMVCFMRPPGQGKPAMGYVLSVTSVAEKQEELQGIFEGAVRSVAVVGIRPPTGTPVTELEEALVSRPAEYSLRRPRGWYQAPAGGAVAMGQTDWMQEAQTVRAWVTVQEVEGGTTARGRAEAVMGMKIPNVKREVLGQGPAKMGGQEGYQFTVRLAPAASRPASGPAVVAASPLVVQRLICVAGVGGKKGRCYSLFLYYQGQDVKGAEEMMEKIAEGFALVGGR